MNPNIRSIPPHPSVWSALAIMRQGEVRHLLVMDGDKLVGVLSNRDYRGFWNELDRMEYSEHP